MRSNNNVVIGLQGQPVVKDPTVHQQQRMNGNLCSACNPAEKTQHMPQTLHHCIPLNQSSTLSINSIVDADLTGKVLQLLGVRIVSPQTGKRIKCFRDGPHPLKQSWISGFETSIDLTLFVAQRNLSILCATKSANQCHQLIDCLVNEKSARLRLINDQ